MRQKRYILVATLLLMVVAMQAQNLNSAYFTDDYKFRHTMNPAFDNDEGYFSIPALGNLNVRTQGNFGYDAVILKNPLAGQAGQKSMTSFMNPYIDEATALSGFSTGNNRIVGNVGVTILSAGFKGFGGYNTIELSSKSSFGVSLPYELFEFAKNTGNKTYDIGDVSGGALSYVELAFGHSHNINRQLRIGAKLKLLVGVGRADIQMEGLKADLLDANRWLIQSKNTVHVSMKGVTYKEKVKEYQKEGRGTFSRVTGLDLDGAGIGGFGVAVDAGAVYQINDDWKVSAALLDLGFISWTNDMLAQNTSNSFEFKGFHDVAVNDKSNPSSFKNQGDNYADQFVDFINVKNQGDQGGRTTGIGATLNAGAEYTLPAYRRLSFGLLSSTRLNGDYTWTEGRLSANWRPLNWLDGGVSFAMNCFSASMGWVLNIHPKGYNFFIGMDHILGKLSKEGVPLSSKASLALGMNITW